MVIYVVTYASYLETEGLDASVLFFDTEEKAQQNLKESYNMILKEFEAGEIEWNDFETNAYSVGGCDQWVNHMRFEAYINKKEIK